MTRPKSRLHNDLCVVCNELKPTGLTLEMHEQWRTKFSRRRAIENAVATLNKNYDESLLYDKMCMHCKGKQAAKAYAAEYNMVVIEHITLIEGGSTHD